MPSRDGGGGADLTEQKLIRGWRTGTARVKIRLANAGDLAAIERLVPEAGVDLGAR